MKRRQFLQTAAFAGAAGLILPRTTLFGADAPSNKLNIAIIGTWGRASQIWDQFASENIVALCDVNEEHLAFGAKRFPGAKTYADWRICLDQKDINAVVIATPDHHHAYVSNWALNRNYHVYCEKPLAICVEDARIARANYLKRKNKVATQVGTQRHEFENFNRVRELIHDGAIGELKSACAWGDRKIPEKGYFAAEGEPPKHVNWDLWLGPAPFHPFNPRYLRGGPGMNCLSWNMFWDFGTGQVGDMGSHTMDIVWNVIDATLPTAAAGKGDPFNPEVTPVMLQTDFDMPANDWRKEIKVSWYQGGAMPESPSRFINLNKIDHGALFEGTHGYLVSSFTDRAIYPLGSKADFTYYKPRAKDKVIPKLGNFQKQWVNACKTDLKTSCDMEYSGNMVETMCLGLVAYRTGKKFAYNGATGKTDSAEADALLSRKPREGWKIDG